MNHITKGAFTFHDTELQAQKKKAEEVKEKNSSSWRKLDIIIKY